MSSLDLRKTTVIGKKAAAGVKRAFDILEEVQQDARDMGLEDYPKPAGTPPPLSNLDPENLQNRDLEVYYTAYVAYAQYIGPKVAAAEAAYKISTSNLARIAANLEAEMHKDEVPKAEIKARVKTHPHWEEQELEHLKLFATKTILEAHYKAYSNQAKALSRIIELRKLEFESQVRGDSIGRARPGQARRTLPRQNFQRPR